MSRIPIPRWFAPAAALLLSSACAGVSPRRSPAPVPIPGYMTESGLFIAEPVTVDGQRLRFRTNTGSGPVSIYTDAAERVGLGLENVLVGPTGPRDEATWVPRASMPELRADASIPPPHADGWAGRLNVSQRGRDAEPWMDGYLGPPWFALRTWTWDFARGQLLLRAPGDLPRVARAHRERLGFREVDGERTEWLPRIRVEVAGEPLDLLLATGAEGMVSDDALRRMELPGPARQGLSSVTREVFEGWRRRHPGWRVIERAVDGGLYAVIQVPEVTVGGHRVGPVWFSSHAAGAAWLSNWTDRPVQGFLGANVLRFFRLTVDFDRGIAVFERP